MNKTHVMFIIVMLTASILVSIIGCGGDDSTSDRASAPSCSEPAKGMSISPDPAFLNQKVTIYVTTSSSGIVVQDILQSITIVDASGDIVKRYDYYSEGLPDGVEPSSGSGWKWTETFTSGTTGRWKITTQYFESLSPTEIKTVEGSFCVNEGTSSVPKITGDVIAPPPINQRVESGEYQAVLRIIQAGECSWAGDYPWELNVHIDADRGGFSFRFLREKEGVRQSVSVDAVYHGGGTAEVDITRETVCGDEPEVHSATSFATIKDGTITIQEYTIIWCERMGCVFRESWVLTKQLVNESALSLPALIVFQTNRDGNYEIYKMNTDGSNQTNLTNNGADDFQPACSPDGSKIAFVSDRDGNSEIYVMDTDGSNQVRLTNNSVDEDWPTWSPDGSKIAFVSDRDGNSEIYMMDTKSSNQFRLTHNSDFDSRPTWSPDGSKIAFVSDRAGNSEIYVMDTDGSNQNRLTIGGGFDWPVWSPDGSKIAFVTFEHGDPEIYKMNTDGSNKNRLTIGGGVTPAWSPDSNKIAFNSWRISGLGDIYIMDADGSNQTRLTNPSVDDAKPDWLSMIGGRGNGASAPAPVPSTTPMQWSSPPAMTIDPDRKYTATIETEKGDLVLELFAKDATVTVNNFVFLAREGFYDGTTFHRVIPTFMAQGGDPAGTGMGGAGYFFADEFTGHTHVAGALSMANAGPYTNSSQFFITYTPQPHLDGKHSVFGQLIEGMEVLEKLENGDIMKRITIREK